MLVNTFFKRCFSQQPKRDYIQDFKDNATTIVAFGAVIGGAFGFGLHLNQIAIMEERIKSAEEKIKSAEKNTEEKIKAAEARAGKESLDRLFGVINQEEYRQSKEKLLASKQIFDEKISEIRMK